MKDETGNKLKGLMDKAVAEKELAGGCLLVRCHGEECCYLEAGMADVEAVSYTHLITGKKRRKKRRTSGQAGRKRSRRKNRK